jgi:hypothetical protein
MRYRIWGAGSPIEIESYHPEIAEAEACQEYGIDVSNIVTLEMKDELLPGECDHNCSAGTGLHTDPE